MYLSKWKHTRTHTHTVRKDWASIRSTRIQKIGSVSERLTNVVLRFGTVNMVKGLAHSFMH